MYAIRSYYVLAPLVNEGRRIEPGSWLVEGIGEDFVPDILDLDLVTKAYSVTDAQAFHTVRGGKVGANRPVGLVISSSTVLRMQSSAIGQSSICLV